jgi:glycosyltransferase involved in cell wall biosynthesis
MRICLVCSEIFAWGKYGGFGRATRMLGRELVKRGVQVVAVVPRRRGQQPEETLDGMRVLGFAPHNPADAFRCYERAQCEIYHSQEASLGSYLAQRAAPQCAHVISFRDHKFWRDWLIELAYPSQNRGKTMLAAAYERNPFVRRAIKGADRLLCASPHLAAPIQRAYHLSAPPEFLGSPLVIPARIPQKSAKALVCFVGRLDRRKRPERFIALAARFPKVEFVMAGAAQDARFGVELRAQAASIGNLTMTGFLQQFEGPALTQLMERAWVLVNTSAREGLPNAMLEALSHRCALLSTVDVSGVAARFGYHAADGDLESGLGWLLGDGRWQELGQRGFEFVCQHFNSDKVLAKHLAIYEQVLGCGPRAAAIGT